MKLTLCLLLLSIVAVSWATECGDLQRLKIKREWAQAYSTGHERLEFALTVWQVFLAQHPEHRDLFANVGVSDLTSPEFEAHMMRVLGGLDAIISVLDDSSVLHQVLHHYAEFHHQFGRLPFKAFGDALGLVIPAQIGHCFDREAWDACFDIIDHDMHEGLNQSPIDIHPHDAEFDGHLWDHPWEMHYIPENTKSIANTGHSVKVAIDYHGSKLSGGPLGSKSFCLEQFHFHWGSQNDKGSEHTVDGHAYPAEVHLVHWNCERYSSFAEAVPSEDGLAVLGVFIDVGDHANEALAAVTDQLANIHHKGQSVSFGPFDPSGLLPADRMGYWTYQGSLTTPPYSETVTWTVFRDPIHLTQAQLDEFRHVMSHADGEPEDEMHHHGPIVDNYRNTLPLHGRPLKAAFH